MNAITGLWHSPAVIAPNNFVFKSLSNWALNLAVGCSHACRFCFHEPINIRAENVARIAGHAQALGVSVNTDVFATRESWLEYALNALQTVERLAAETGLADRLHLWPDKSLGSQAAVRHLSARTGLAPDQFREWLHRWWNRLSEWPSRSTTTAGH
jgi:hypothetical protein